MRAILLAAGLGTRLRPLTDTVPKCLVSIHGTPLLGLWLERLSLAGHGPFLVNTHYLPEQVEAFIRSSRHRSRVTLVHEATLAGTAGTLVANADFFEGEDGLLLHADNYTTADFRAFAQAHEGRVAGCAMTMMAFQTDEPSRCGIVEVDSKGVVIGFHEKVQHPPGTLANGAIYALAPELIAELRGTQPPVFDFSTEVIPRLLGRIQSFETRSVFIDVGTAENLARANAQPA